MRSDVLPPSLEYVSLFLFAPSESDWNPGAGESQRGIPVICGPLSVTVPEPIQAAPRRAAFPPL